jgi:hypothetical protein
MIQKLKRKLHSSFPLKAYRALNNMRQLRIRQEIDRLMAKPKYQDPKSLVPYNMKVYSQNGEDGIIQEIFNRIGTTNKVFVEFGVGNGLENNTLTLLFSGWCGLWIEGSNDFVQSIQENYPSVLKSKQLQLVHSFITRDNIDAIISNHIEETEIDLLSIDIDGNDYYVLDAIQSVTPRVIVLEYNPKFIPPIEYCITYNETHAWDNSDHFGASLKSFEKLLSKKGYSLVGCELVGSNAFFVRNDLLADHFISDNSAEFHFEPARHYLSGFFSGHPASYQTLDKKA